MKPAKGAEISKVTQYVCLDALQKCWCEGKAMWNKIQRKNISLQKDIFGFEFRVDAHFRTKNRQKFCRTWSSSVGVYRKSYLILFSNLLCLFNNEAWKFCASSIKSFISTQWWIVDDENAFAELLFKENGIGKKIETNEKRKMSETQQNMCDTYSTPSFDWHDTLLLCFHASARQNIRWRARRYVW